MAPVAAPPKVLKPIVDAGLRPDQLARLTGRSERTARRWLAGETEPRGAVLRPLGDVVEVIEEYSRVFPGGDVARWLDHRDPEFDFRTPSDLIEAGRSREVLGLLLAIGEGVYL